MNVRALSSAFTHTRTHAHTPMHSYTLTRYHNEHHDFPNIPGSRLPILRKMASEFYDNLPYHESWPLVTWKFVTDPNVGVWNRVKRKGNVRVQMMKNVTEEEKEGVKTD